MKNQFAIIRQLVLALSLGCFVFSCNPEASSLDDTSVDATSASSDWNAGQVLGEISKKIARNLAITQYDKPFPRTIKEGKVHYVASKDWTSGFYPGTLWYLYAANKKANFLQAAKEWTALMQQEQFNTYDHDVGFQMGSSYGNGYKFTCEALYLPIILQSAQSQVTRYSEIVRAIQSWNPRNGWEFPVIIDNLMNLELLFEASKLSGDSSFYKVAYQHAMTTHEHHFRENSSSFHVVNYDSITGEVKSRQTHQGFTDHSSWARGQAWGLYGYTMTYRYTKEPVFLERAKDIAAYIMNRLPDNGIPLWDYDAPVGQSQPLDASAASIMASALLELEAYDMENKVKYHTFAEKILKTLSQPSFRLDQQDGTPFILNHSTGHKPYNSEIDVPINYADYYFVEALYRFQQLQNNSPITLGFGNCLTRD